MDTDSFIIRRATPQDAGTLVANRRGMFWDMGHHDTAALDSMLTKFKPWVVAKMEAEEYLSWLAIAEDGTVASGADLWLLDWPPHMLAQRRGYILNVYTDPRYRRRGLARRLMNVAIEWCRANGIDMVVLHASQFGRPLYESMGFSPTTEMKMIL